MLAMVELHDGRIAEFGKLKAYYNLTKKRGPLKDRKPAEQALIEAGSKSKWITLIQKRLTSQGKFSPS